MSNLRRFLASLARSHPSLAPPGEGLHDSLGAQSTYDPEPLLYARLDEAPDDTHPGYSWTQVAAGSGGTFVELPAEDRLSGRNGTSGGTGYQQAFPVNDAAFNAGDYVFLVRGYTHNDWAAGYAEGVGILPAGNQQEWLILSGAGTGTCFPWPESSCGTAATLECQLTFHEVSCGSGGTGGTLTTTIVDLPSQVRVCRATAAFTVPPCPEGPTGATGDDGHGAEVSIDTVTTGAPGSSAVVTVAHPGGNLWDAVLSFTLPRGMTGPIGTGATGAAATIAVGTVTTGTPGSAATVTNVGTTSAAVFDFSIPAGTAGTGGGDPGQAGATGATGPAFLTVRDRVAVNTYEDTFTEVTVLTFNKGVCGLNVVEGDDGEPLVQTYGDSGAFRTADSQLVLVSNGLVCSVSSIDEICTPFVTCADVQAAVDAALASVKAYVLAILGSGAISITFTPATGGGCSATGGLTVNDELSPDPVDVTCSYLHGQFDVNNVSCPEE